LVGVGGGIDEHLVASERRAGDGAAGRIADGGSEVADEEDGLVAEELELAKFFQGDRVAEMEVWRGRIHAELDAERSAKTEFFEEFLFRKHLGSAGDKSGELLFRRHGQKVGVWGYAGNSWDFEPPTTPRRQNGWGNGSAKSGVMRGSSGSNLLP
jgi:hypothetical protein